MTTTLTESAFRAPAVRLAYGNIAIPLPKGAKSGVPDDHTHRWTIFLRGADNQDISYAVAKVVFHIHDSFASPSRGERGVSVRRMPRGAACPHAPPPPSPALRRVHRPAVHRDGDGLGRL